MVLLNHGIIEDRGYVLKRCSRGHARAHCWRVHAVKPGEKTITETQEHRRLVSAAMGDDARDIRDVDAQPRKGSGNELFSVQRRER